MLCIQCGNVKYNYIIIIIIIHLKMHTSDTFHLYVSAKRVCSLYLITFIICLKLIVIKVVRHFNVNCCLYLFFFLQINLL